MDLIEQMGYASLIIYPTVFSSILLSNYSQLAPHFLELP